MVRHPLRAALQRGRHVASGFDDVPELLALGLAHRAPQRLHDIDLAVARIEEGDSVERRHLHAFHENLGVADNPDLAVAIHLREGAEF